MHKFRLLATVPFFKFCSWCYVSKILKMVFFIIHVVAARNWNLNDAVTPFLFFFSFLFSLFTFFFFSLFIFFFLYYILLILLGIFCDLINKILTSFSHTLLNCLYMYIGFSTINVLCHLSSVAWVFHILYLCSRLDNITYSHLVFELSVICVSSTYTSLYSKIASRQFVLWWYRFNKLAHKFVYPSFCEFFAVQYHSQ